MKILLPLHRILTDPLYGCQAVIDILIQQKPGMANLCLRHVLRGVFHIMEHIENGNVQDCHRYKNKDDE